MFIRIIFLSVSVIEVVRVFETFCPSEKGPWLRPPGPVLDGVEKKGCGTVVLTKDIVPTFLLQIERGDVLY